MESNLADIQNAILIFKKIRIGSQPWQKLCKFERAFKIVIDHLQPQIQPKAEFLGVPIQVKPKSESKILTEWLWFHTVLHKYPSIDDILCLPRDKTQQLAQLREKAISTWTQLYEKIHIPALEALNLDEEKLEKLAESI